MTTVPRVRPVGALVLFAAIAAMPAPALAQRTTTGTVAGKVVDSSGAVLPGVTVQLTRPTTSAPSCQGSAP